MKISQIACALALAVSAVAQAAPVTVQFSGLVDTSDVAGYDVDSEISGQFTYDTDAASLMDPQALGDGFSIVTYGVNAPDALTFNIGGDVLSFSNLGIAIFDSVGEVEGGESFSILADVMTLNGVPGSPGAVMLTFNTSGTNPDVLSLALPSSLNLADFDSPFAAATGSFLTDLTSNGQSVSFNITSLTTTAVPEPGSALTMLLGFGLMGGLVHRRRSAAR
jgi:hypothetical protein